jgi:hypothetical protein
MGLYDVYCDDCGLPFEVPDLSGREESHLTGTDVGWMRNVVVSMEDGSECFEAEYCDGYGNFYTAADHDTPIFSENKLEHTKICHAACQNLSLDRDDERLVRDCQKQFFDWDLIFDTNRHHLLYRPCVTRSDTVVTLTIDMLRPHLEKLEQLGAVLDEGETSLSTIQNGIEDKINELRETIDELKRQSLVLDSKIWLPR